MDKHVQKAIIFGAGNIGRGFIAQLLCESEYEITFADVNDTLINQINSVSEYPIFITDTDDYRKEIIKNFHAINSGEIGETFNADVIFTSVGVNALKYIVEPISKLISNNKPINIFICENLIGADEYFKSLFTADTSNVGFIQTSIGRMVTDTPDYIKKENSLAVCTEPFNTLYADKKNYIETGLDIKNIKFFDDFDFVIKQKLSMFNMSHAMTAYLGNIKKYDYIWESISDIDIRYKVLSALLEIACALHKEYKADIIDLIKYSYEIIERFNNKLLNDTNMRVGRDVKRKISRNDRFGSAIDLCVKHDIFPKNILTGLTAALFFGESEINACITEHGIIKTINDYCEIYDKLLIDKIMTDYQILT